MCYAWAPPADANTEANPKEAANLSDSILRFKEDSTCCWRLWVGGQRPFRMCVERARCASPLRPQLRP